MASRMASEFVKRWRDELLAHRQSKKGGTVEHDLWEGAQAYENLRDRGLLEYILFREEPRSLDWKKRQLLLLLSTEIRKYKRCSGKVSAINGELKEAVDFMKRMGTWFSKEQKQFHHLTEVRKLLAVYADDIRKDGRRLEQKRQNFWRSPTGLEAILREPDYEWGPDRDKDLDGGFQKRVARILRLSLPEQDGITLRTICRLVVLVYVAAGFIDERAEKTTIKLTGKLLYPHDLEKKFQRSGLDS